jgi:hypothetical protein
MSTIKRYSGARLRLRKSGYQINPASTISQSGLFSGVKIAIPLIFDYH